MNLSGGIAISHRRLFICPEGSEVQSRKETVPVQSASPTRTGVTGAINAFPGFLKSVLLLRHSLIALPHTRSVVFARLYTVSAEQKIDVWTWGNSYICTREGSAGFSPVYSRAFAAGLANAVKRRQSHGTWSTLATPSNMV